MEGLNLEATVGVQGLEETLEESECATVRTATSTSLPPAHEGLSCDDCSHLQSSGRSAPHVRFCVAQHGQDDVPSDGAQPPSLRGRATQRVEEGSAATAAEGVGGPGRGRGPRLQRQDTLGPSCCQPQPRRCEEGPPPEVCHGRVWDQGDRERDNAHLDPACHVPPPGHGRACGRGVPGLREIRKPDLRGGCPQGSAVLQLGHHDGRGRTLLGVPEEVRHMAGEREGEEEVRTGAPGQVGPQPGDDEEEAEGGYTIVGDGEVMVKKEKPTPTAAPTAPSAASSSQATIEQLALAVQSLANEVKTLKEEKGEKPRKILATADQEMENQKDAP